MVDVVLRTSMSSRYQTLAGIYHPYVSSDPDSGGFQWLNPQLSLEDVQRSPRTLSAESRRRGRPQTDKGTCYGKAIGPMNAPSGFPQG